MAAAAGVMAAIAMLAGTVMPDVHAGSVYRAEDVTLGVTIVYEGDQLVYPTWGEIATQGMQIRYLDATGNVIGNDSTSDKSSYTIPTYSELGLNAPLPDGVTTASWRVTVAPTQEPEQIRWDLALYTGESVSSGDAGRESIKSPGAYDLQADRIYILENGIRRVKGDATVYASPVEFTVDTTGKYNFFY